MKFIDLKRFRKERIMAQKVLSAQTGLSQSTISYIESGALHLRPSHLKSLQKGFPDEDFTPYIYESPVYPHQMKEYMHSLIPERELSSDMWIVPCPLQTINSHPIICHKGRIYISTRGWIILDRNDGSSRYVGYQIIPSHQLSDSHLIARMMRKTWFDASLYEDFRQAYLIACRLAKVNPAEQLRLSVNTYNRTSYEHKTVYNDEM